jgi:dUTP pyrophosphatase
MLIFSRSGHGFKNDVRLSNCVGVIDSDYRGEVQIKLSNDGGDHFTINNDDRIAQAMLVKLPWVELIEVDELSETARGTNGFGSTGS